jgi:hypothetical protein
LGHGGPPVSPIPSGNEQDFVTHGVQVRTFFATAYDGSHMLALFPGRDAWVSASSTRRHAANLFADIRRVIRSVRPARVAGYPQSYQGNFVGQWYVHGALLDVQSEQAGVFTDTYVACNGKCITRYKLSLSRAPSFDHRLVAVVREIRFVDPKSDRDVKPPIRSRSDPSQAASKIGRPFFTLSFVTPRLLLSTVRSFDNFGNPYWCSRHLPGRLGYACGA